MHQLALQPYLQAAARREAAGNGKLAVGIRAVRQPPRPVADPLGRPRGVLASRLRIAGYPFDVAIAPDGAAWLHVSTPPYSSGCSSSRSRPPVSFASASLQPA